MAQGGVYLANIAGIWTLTEHRWEGVAQLPGGAQADVYLVRPKARRDERVMALDSVVTALTHLTDAPTDYSKKAAEIAHGIAGFNKNEVEGFGVLKVFPHESAQARTRFGLEVTALTVVKDPGIVELLDVDLDKAWMVTRYLPGGHLEDARSRFTGDARKALAGFRPVVAAVAKLHSQEETPYVHRDIKPKNVFVAADGGLVLGDFGIVFLDHSQRPTELLERVGSRDWMPPWAHGGRIEAVRPTFDVYMLGKVLWWMLSRTFMPREWHRHPSHPEHNLEGLFPQDPWMTRVNDILDRCLVEDEVKCLPNAVHLLTMIDRCLNAIERGGQPLGLGLRRHCTVCGLGTYETIEAMEGKDVGPRPRVVALPTSNAVQGAQHVQQVKGWFLPGETHGATVRVFACDQCGHMQLFKLDEDRDRRAWQPKHSSS